MRKTIAFAFLLAASASAAAAQPSAGQLGVGVELGEQNGATAKYWVNDTQAVDLGLGESDGDFSAHASYSWHAWDILPKPPRGTLGVYAGLGARIRDDEFGLRPSAGLDYWVENHPIEAFFEGAPVFRLSPDTGVDYTAVIGVRFYFDAARLTPARRGRSS